jgi:hypothetical protein
MKKIFTLTISFLIGLSSLNAQVFKKFDPVICPVDHNTYDTFVPAPEKFKSLSARGQNNNANIIVNYNGFTQEAQDASVCSRYLGFIAKVSCPNSGECKFY